MTPAEQQTPTKATVVDAAPEDYRRLTRSFHRAIEFHFYRTGREALRHSECRLSRLWLINLHLPDMSGLDLLEMLELDRSRTSVFLVADTYSAEDERSALEAGVARYLCKPPVDSWLVEWRRPPNRDAAFNARPPTPNTGVIP